MIELPVPFDAESEAHAGLYHGRRSVSWTFRGDAMICRNRCEIYWVTVEELVAWKQEPLRVTCERRVTLDGGRQPFTEAARVVIREAFLKAIAKASGFHAVWSALWLPSLDDGTDAVVQARRKLEWHQACAELRAWLKDGLVEIRPLTPDPTGRSAPRQPTADPNHYGSWVAPCGEAWLDGEQVGWMTDDGRVIPMRHVLEPSPD